MQDQLIDHITQTTCQLIEGIALQRTGRVPNGTEWARMVRIVDLSDHGWAVYFDGMPILRMRLTSATTAQWEFVEGA